MRRPRYRVIQSHHPDYAKPEETVLVFKSEHNVITRLNRLAKSKPSAYFVDFLDNWIWPPNLVERRDGYVQEEMEALQAENMRKKAESRKRRRKKR